MRRFRHDPAPPAEKPALRGRLHQWAAACALGAGAVLVAMAPSARAAVASAIYSLSLFTLFSVSASYHRVTWDAGPREWMRRADHASIFLLIAGTYTPVAMLGLPRHSGNSLLVAIWIGAGLGIAQSLFWIRAPKIITAIIAVAVGWTLVPYLGDAWRAFGGTELVLLAVGGVAYTLGAVAYALKRPNPRPGVFGYHEVFHALTIVAAVLHFAAVILIVRSAG